MRGVWGIALVSVLGMDAEAQRAPLPALSAQGIARTHILCLLVDPTGPKPRLEKVLCAQVRRIAAAGAPVPVDVISFGDPALIQPDALGVLVHVAIDRAGPRPLAVISIRPHRTQLSAAVMFGATPAAVPIGADGAIPDAAIATALDQVLPWRQHSPR
jgi:hypothetical protein